MDISIKQWVRRCIGEAQTRKWAEEPSQEAKDERLWGPDERLFFRIDGNYDELDAKEHNVSVEPWPPFEPTESAATEVFRLIAAEFQECQGISVHAAWFDDNWIAAFAEIAPHLPNIRHLHFGNEHKYTDDLFVSLGSMTDDGLAALAQCAEHQHLLNLDSLRISSMPVGNEGLEALATRIRYLPKLRCLSFHHTNVDDRGMEALAAQGESLTNLEDLDFSFSKIGDEGLKALAARLHHMPKLHVLRFYHSEWDNDSAGKLVPRPVGIGDTGLQALAAGLENFATKLGRPTELTTLDFAGTRIGNTGIEALAEQARHLSNLAGIDVNNTRVGDAGLQALAAQMKHFTIGLEYLGLSNTRVGDPGLEGLAVQSQYLTNLTWLDLHGTRVSDISLKILAEHAHDLKSLEWLKLSCTRISDRGVEAFAAAESSLPKLKTLLVDGARTALPPELIRGFSAHAIFQWIRERDAGHPLGEIKLMVVGQGRVGKTHVVARLSNPAYFNANENPTHHVSRSGFDLPWPAALGNWPAALNVQVWDFGGQSELHSSHRFFLGALRCFYLLVLRADRPADGDDSNRLGYWLRMIAHHGRNGDDRAPVLICVTQCDRKERDVDAQRSCDELMKALSTAEANDWHGARVVGKIIGIGYSADVETMAPAMCEQVKKENEDACCDLREAIERNVANIPDINRPYPQSFFAMRQWVKKVFSRSKFEGDGRGAWSFDLSPRLLDELAVGMESAQAYLSILNSIGLTHWLGDRKDIARAFDTNLRLRAYNPGLISEPVYKLIRFSSAKPGIVTKDEVLQELSSLNEGQLASVVALMKACYLAYENREGLLIPDLLKPTSRSERGAPPFFDTPPVWLKAKFLPEQAFLRLVAEWYHRIDDPDRHCFRNEVRFNWPEGDLKVPTLIRAVYSPSGGEDPYLEVIVASNNERIRHSVICTLNHEMNRIFESQELTDCWIGFVKTSERPEVDRWSDLTIAIYIDSRAGKTIYYAIERRLGHNAPVARTKEKTLDLTGNLWPKLFALYANESVDGFVKSDRIVAELKPDLLQHAPTGRADKKASRKVRTLSDKAGRYVIETIAGLKRILKSQIDCQQTKGGPFEPMHDGYRASFAIGCISPDDNGDLRFRLPTQRS